MSHFFNSSPQWLTDAPEGQDTEGGDSYNWESLLNYDPTNPFASVPLTDSFDDHGIDVTQTSEKSMYSILS